MNKERIARLEKVTRHCMRCGGRVGDVPKYLPDRERQQRLTMMPVCSRECYDAVSQSMRREVSE